MEIKEYIELMKKDYSKFNELRKEENYKKLIIRNVDYLNIKYCDLENIIFISCNYSKFDECDYGKFIYCYDSNFVSCDNGQFKLCHFSEFKACTEGQFKFCNSSKFELCDHGKFRLCNYGSFIICNLSEFRLCYLCTISFSMNIDIKDSYIKHAWCSIYKEKNNIKNDIDFFIKIMNISIDNETKKLILYKTVNKDYKDYYTNKIKFEIGKEIECLDWKDNNFIECGSAFHCSTLDECIKIAKENDYHILKVLVAKEDINIYIHNLNKIRCKKLFVLREIFF